MSLISDLSFSIEASLMIVPIKVADDGEHYFEIPDEILKELGWQAGDSVIWTQNKDGSFSLTKNENEL
ncbi:AbrB/MazE/SpoVT family DNA-binding domain-containing protein [Vibrio sp. zbq_2]|uniref:AbrB/MazE/SpoVT family DNA-binding domain-containing protein n=1 Tax=Vibrio sp. zbq_2 TaxID=3367238 RepID=UPI00370B69C8